VHHFLRCLLYAGLFYACAAAASVDKNFLAARDAYAKGRIDQFERLADKIPNSYPLHVYLDYWRLKSYSTSAGEWAKFAADHPETPLSERVRQDLARFYGGNEDWDDFRQVDTLLTRKDTEIQCYELRARLAGNDRGAIIDGLGLWLTAQDLPSSCDPLFAKLASLGFLTDGIRFARLRLALEAGNLPLARQLVATLPPGDKPNLLEQAQRSPESLLAQTPATQIEREIDFYALSLIAKKDPDRAAQIWQGRLQDFPGAEQQYGWGVIALAAARQVNPEAVTWYLNAKDQVSVQQNIWKARTMLRYGRWLDLYTSIAVMPEATRNEEVWLYWKARALQAMHANDKANQIFAKLSHEIDYYGLLAGEELPETLEALPSGNHPTPDEIDAARKDPDLARALLLHKLELNVDATREWDWAIRSFDDIKLLAAAELARRAQWYDRAIKTAEQTKTTHSLDLRYLTPYRDLADAYSDQNGLDPAWVYGLMRQESRFMDYARSGAGARGLMQIMPATARWLARLMGFRHKATPEIGDPDVNIKFGTYYLKRLLTRLDDSTVLATAGYNAGPGRARRWQADVPLEGAVYVESIPIPETREYVKKVLANAMYYSQRLRLKGNSLKERLGVVPAQAVTPPVTEDAGGGN
jgi:soluble lytic murein transglycosylase